MASGKHELAGFILGAFEMARRQPQAFRVVTDMLLLSVEAHSNLPVQ
jgi:hypothetical protein